MAAWTFRFSYLPLSGILFHHGNLIPEHIEGYKAVDINKFDENRDYKNYWVKEKSTPHDLIKLPSVFKEKKHWDNTAHLYEDEYGNQIELWDDDFCVALNLANFNSDRIKDIVGIGHEFYLKIICVDDGNLMEASFEDLMAKIKNSSAYKYSS